MSLDASRRPARARPVALLPLLVVAAATLGVLTLTEQYADLPAAGAAFLLAGWLLGLGGRTQR